MLTSFISLLIQTTNATGGGAPAAAAGDAGVADAAAAGGAAGGGFSGLIMIVALIAIFYFLMIRPQQKKQKKIRQEREALKAGDSVVTAGGIYGKIASVENTSFILSIADGVKIKVDKNSVYPGIEDVQASQQK